MRRLGVGSVHTCCGKDGR